MHASRIPPSAFHHKIELGMTFSMIDLSSNETSFRFAAIAIYLTTAIIALTFGASFLIPIVVAFMLTNVLEALTETLQRFSLPTFIALPISLLVALFLVSAFVYIITNQVDEFIAAWPRYLERLENLSEETAAMLGQDTVARIQTMLSDLNLTAHLSSALGSVGTMLLNLGLVLLYCGFLLAERGRFFKRLLKIAGQFGDKDHAAIILTAVSSGVRHYLFIKTVISLITAITSYGVLRYIGLDFAETWAVGIFLLNDIPSIGSVLGVVFPALLALLQFDTITPFLLISLGLTGLQFSIGNVLEPSLMGRSLNLSPFVVIVSLTFWSMIWGLAGAFLAVPITAAIVILCREVHGWQWIALLLSNADPQAQTK